MTINIQLVSALSLCSRPIESCLKMIQFADLLEQPSLFASLASGLHLRVSLGHFLLVGVGDARHDLRT